MRSSATGLLLLVLAACSPSAEPPPALPQATVDPRPAGAATVEPPSRAGASADAAAPACVPLTAKIPAPDHRPRSGVARIRVSAVVEDFPVPPSLLGHDEDLKGLFASGETLFVAGINYTGVPGPDPGVVYRRDPGGSFRIVYVKEQTQLHTITGTSPDDVWVAGAGVLVHYDGRCWREESVPGDAGYVAGLYAERSGLWAVVRGRTDEESRIFRRQRGGAWQEQATIPSQASVGFGQVGDELWAAGTRGVFRQKSGEWAPFSTIEGDNLWAPTPHDVLVAGHGLFHSHDGGPFRRLPVGIKISRLPNKQDAQVMAVAGRSLDDYYAGTLSDGVAHFDGRSFTPTAYTGNVWGMAYQGDSLFVLHLGKLK